MPVYRLQGPDGRVYKVEGPDGASAEQLGEFVIQNYQPATVDDSASPLGSTAQNFAAGMGRAVVRAGNAVKQALDVPAQAIENFVGNDRSQRISRYLGMPTAAESAQQTRDSLAEAESLDRPLMETKAGKLGDIAGNVAMFAPTAMIPGANTVTGAGIVGGIGGALTTPGDLSDRAAAGAFGAAGGAVGQKVGQKIGEIASNRIASKMAAVEATKQQNAVRDAALREAIGAGYVVPPATSNPTTTNRVLESIGGKAMTQQTASLKNQKVTNRLARESLGLTENAPLTEKTMKEIRAGAGKVYDEISKSGRVSTDDVYRNDLLSLSAVSDRLKADFPDLAVSGKDEIVKLTDALAKDSFDARSAVEAVKTLRSQGSKNLSGIVSASDPAKQALGKAQLSAAEAVEDQLMRHLSNSGRPELAGQFDEARRLIAKTYSVQNALNPNTGNVAASKLTNQLKKGKQLSDGLDVAARFGGAFPKAATEVSDSAGVSALDAFGGLGLAAATGNPVATVIPALARGATRHAILSDRGNALLATPKYSANVLRDKTAAYLAPRLGLPLGATYALEK